MVQPPRTAAAGGPDAPPTLVPARIGVVKRFRKASPAAALEVPVRLAYSGL
jgi:hypothetical protein